MAATDDGSSEEATLPFAIDFFGPNRTSAFVNNNGNVTFDGPLSEYTPTAIRSSGMKIIAPFWADVDTTGAESGLVQYGTTTFEGHTAFCVNWAGVGYFSGRTDKLNSVQLLLVRRDDTGSARNFDMILNYGQVEWESGEASGGIDGLGGFPARVGYSNGGSLSFELSGSNTPGAFLDTSPNGLVHRSIGSSTAGRIVIPVRGGVPSPPDTDQAGAPGAPGDPAAQSAGQGKVKVSWTAPVDVGDSAVTSYDVYRDGVLVGSVASEETTAGRSEAGPARHNFVDRTIPTGRPVNYDIVAINAAGASRRASTVGIRVLGSRPAYSRVPPLNLATPNGRALRNAIWVPALQEHFTPQGLTILPAGVGGLWPTATLLVSGYTAASRGSSSGRCYVHAVNPATGQSRGWYRFPASPCGHAGGIEYTTGNRIWVADTHTLFLLNVAHMFNARTAVFAIKHQLQLGGVNGSFVFDQPAGAGCAARCLWIGHWRDGQRTRIHRYNENDLADRGRRYVFASRHSVLVPRDAQGAAWKNNQIIVSASTSQCGLLHGVSPTTGARFWTRQFSPGTEEIALDGASGIWNVSEAGAWRFSHKPAFFPVIARWNLGDLQGEGRC